jgi:hypothetical protein
MKVLAKGTRVTNAKRYIINATPNRDWEWFNQRNGTMRNIYTNEIKARREMTRAELLNDDERVFEPGSLCGVVDYANELSDVEEYSVAHWSAPPGREGGAPFYSGGSVFQSWYRSEDLRVVDDAEWAALAARKVM